MEKLVSVSAAAELFSLDRQTIYRKIKRGELPVVRVGKTIRVVLPDILKQNRTPVTQANSNFIPDFIFRLLWDVDKSSIKTGSQQVIERVLDLGDIGDVAWLFATHSRQELRQFLSSKRARRLSKQSLAFWSDYFEVHHEGVNSISGPTKTLGETDWR